MIQEYPGSYIQCVVERDSSESKRKMFDAMTGNVNELNMPEFYDKRLNTYPNVFFRPNSLYKVSRLFEVVNYMYHLILGL